ncbi:7418_t:CDS:2, partial [Racocetra persica]
NSTTLNSIRNGIIGGSRVVEKQEMAVYSSKDKLVKALLDKTKNLKTYLEYCGVTGQRAIPSSEDFLLSCLIWLDLTDAVSVCSDILAAVSSKHLERSLPDLSKLYNVRRVYKALMKESRKDRKPEWPCDPLPIFALR